MSGDRRANVVTGRDYISRITIQRLSRLLTASVALAWIAIAAIAWETLHTTRLNGPIHCLIQQRNDLIADVAPPPVSLLESYLVVQELANAPSSQRTPWLKRRLLRLEQDYVRRRQHWASLLPAGELRTSLTVDADSHAAKFFACVHQQFLPRLERGDYAGARALARGRLWRDYHNHRLEVAELLRLARSDLRQTELAAQTAMRRRFALLAVIGLALATGCVAASRLLASSVVARLQETIRVLDRVASGDLSARCAVTGNNEFTRMAVALNAAIAASERNLRLANESCDVLERQLEEQERRERELDSLLAQAARDANEMGAVRCELESRNRELEHSEAQSRAIFESSIDAVIVVDCNGRITEFNPAATAIFGRQRDEVLGQQMAELLVPEPLREAHRAGWERYFQTGESKILGRLIQAPALRRDGSVFPAEISIVRVDGDGPASFFAYLRDISDRVRHETEIKAALDAAEAANRAKSEFLANMSHEIRTPMTAILGFADILLEDGDVTKAPERRLETVRTIQRNGAHLLSIINDVLDLSKIEAGKFGVERSRCALAPLIKQVVSLIRVRAQSKAIALEVAYVTPMPETFCTDATRLRQILVNLLGNAIKFTEIGAVKLEIAFLNGDAPKMQFDVVDSGIGITPQQQTRLFQPFTQADTSMTRRYGGTGLGLTISKRLAQMLGGDVVLVESHPGSGSRFRLTIDAGCVDSDALVAPGEIRDESAAPAVHAPESHQALAGAQVLLAEDGPDNQRLIAFALKKAGAAVTVVENGQLAVDAALQAVAAQQPFDVILMDMQMPVLDGYGAAAMLRSHGYTLPIIALTAHAMSGDREKCLAAGCTEYATKPIDRRHLVSLIASFCTQRDPVAAEPAP